MVSTNLNEVASPLTSNAPHAGMARLGFRYLPRKGTVIQTAFAASPLRILAPRNHGNAAWVFLSSLGGGLVAGDRLSVEVDVHAGASALLGTQASTKVYRSAPQGPGCVQRLSARIGPSGILTLVPDPVVCFAGANYDQSIEIDLAPTASLLLLEGYTCGRSARGERWAFSRFVSRTVISRGASPAIIDATRLDARHGPIAARMGRFDVLLSLIALGPAFTAIRDVMLATLPPPGAGDSVLVATSPIGGDGGIVRVAAQRFEAASLTLRASFQALSRILGDDPFARKW